MKWAFSSADPLSSGVSVRINQWLAGRRRFMVVLVLLSAVFVRVVYMSQIWNSPCAWQHQWVESDMYFFDVWGKKVAGGDLLTAKPLHPYPEWTMTTADDYFRIYPERRAAYQEKVPVNAVGRDARHELWDEWYCAPCLHQEPAYPYLLALTYRLFGPDPRYVFIWQALLGVLSIVLVFLITLRLFDDISAVVASLLAVMSGPLLFYEGVLLRDSLVIPSGLGLVLVMIRLTRDAKPWQCLAAGSVFGLTLLIKSIFMPLVFIQALYLLFHGGKPSRQSSVNALVFVAGVFLCLAPVIARNIHVGAPPLSLSSVNAFTSTFINSNAADSAPGHGYCISSHFAGIMGKTGGRSLPVVAETLKTHSSFYSIVSLLWSKWSALWHWYEQPNNTNFYYYRLHIPLLACLPVTFLLVSPLAIIGIFIAAGNWRRRWPLYLVAGNILGVLMLGLVLARYRMSFQAILLPFAACTIVFLADALLARRKVPLLIVLAAVAGISLWTMRPLPPSRPLIRCADYSAVYQSFYSRYAIQAISAGSWGMAADLLLSSLKYEPEVVKQMGPLRPAANRDESSLAGLYAQVHQRIGEALKNSNQEGKGDKHLLRSRELQAAVR